MVEMEKCLYKELKEIDKLNKIYKLSFTKNKGDVKIFK